MPGKATTAEVPEVVERALVEGTFSVEKFTESFPALVEASGGVHRVKCLVTEIAVRGRLCSPAETDEPVDRQLARILQEKAAEARSKAIAAILSVETPPFDIPPRWRWIRWGDLVLATGSGWSPQCENRPRQDGEWGVLKVSAVSWRVFQPEENKALPMGVEPRIEFAAHAGDFLMSRANTAELVGRSVIVSAEPKRLLLSDKLVRCTFSKHIEQQYVNLYNRTTTARAHYLSHASGTSESMKNISREVILSMPVPLPPLAEQKRIVARVDQLMALIDQLEAKQNRKRDLGARFTKASLEALTTAESPQSLTTAWTRLQENWPTILDHPDKVEDVREFLVGLAVQGRLVPSQADRQSAQLCLGDIVLTMDAGWSPNCPSQPTETESQWGVLKTTAVQRNCFLPEHHKALPRELVPRPPLEVHSGDLLVTRAGPTARVGIACAVSCVRPRLMLSDKIIRARLDPSRAAPGYVALALNTGIAREFLTAAQSGMDLAQVNISQDRLRRVPLFLPAVAEQKRIVAKVEHLMKLCDALEAALRRREDRAAKLAEAVVQEMVA